MKVLICGGRNFGIVKKNYSNDEEYVIDVRERVLPERKLFHETFIKLKSEYSYSYDPCGKSEKCFMEVISGMATGADTLAVEWAEAFSLKIHKFPVKDWTRYGKYSGNMRNQEMLDQAKPDLVVAFQGGTGTADMIARAKFEGIPVREIK